MTERVTILGGKLLRSRDAAVLAEVWRTEPALYCVEHPLSPIDGGEAPTGDYRGPATIATDAAGRTVIFLGDPTTTANLAEYVVGDATPESMATLEAYAAGFRAGFDGKRRRPIRRSWDEPEGRLERAWLEGHAEGKRRAR